MKLPALAPSAQLDWQFVLLRLLVWLGVAALAVFLVTEVRESAQPAIDAIEYDHSVTEAPLLPYTDFEMFYAGATVARSENREQLYEKQTVVRQILLAQGYTPSEIPDEIETQDPEHIWLRYYNPPAYLFAWAPATLLDVRDAYLVAVGLNVALLGVLAVTIGYVVRWHQPQALLLILALFAFAPVYYTLHHAQPSILIAGLMAGGYLALRSGRVVASGLLLSLTGVKPHLLLSPATLMKDRRLIVPFFGGCIVFLALPFLILGPGSILDYARLVLDRGGGDLTNETYGEALWSWSGFFRALTGEPQPMLWLIASVATLGLYARVWLRAGSAVTLAAAVPTFLLIVPHSHAQDWTLMIVAAAVLLSLRWSPLAIAGIGAALLGVLIGANEWIHQARSVIAGETQIFWVSLAGFGLLAWLAALTWLHGDEKVIRTGDEVPAGS